MVVGQRALFERDSFGIPFAGREAPERPNVIERYFPNFDIAPDLGSRIGTLTWYRGAATCIGLCGLALLMSPGFENPIYGYVPPALSGGEWDAAKAQAIAPLAKGAGTGKHMAETALVSPLSETPERPIVNLAVKLLSGNSMLGALQRSGVGGSDAGQVVALIGKAMELGQIQPGTSLDLTLGRRADKSQPRPLENLAFRARFDLKLEVARTGNALALHSIPIAVDHTPLRLQGEFGPSLYRAARAAGAPAKAVEAYIKSVATRVPMSRMGAGCKFDLIMEQARAETGEVQLGNLMFAGVNGCASKVQLVRWKADGRDSWYDASGKGESRGMMTMPTHGRISSSFGMRRHPILGFTRMHKGIDIAVAYGSPVYAATDGVVQFAGRSSGYGNFVKLSHGEGLGTGYGHLSRIFVRPGQRVRKGQMIAASGNSGLSTGPHLHYELYKNGVAINPASMSFTVVQQLRGDDLSDFRAKLGQLMAVPVAAAPKHEDEGE
ncbi:MAG: M23 family metallopeptidase [Sphingomonas sp.]|nr:M23 family metallopeptidase [Sphingomonas sp.]